MALAFVPPPSEEERPLLAEGPATSDRARADPRSRAVCRCASLVAVALAAPLAWRHADRGTRPAEARERTGEPLGTSSGPAPAMPTHPSSSEDAPVAAAPPAAVAPAPRVQRGAVAIRAVERWEDCSSRGVFNPYLSECRCTAGWTGAQCEVRDARPCNRGEGVLNFEALCAGDCDEDRGFCNTVGLFR